MNNLSFRFPATDTELRVILKDDESTWFATKDACLHLGLENSRQAIASLDDDEKGVIISDTPGGKQQISVISESGLYALIFKSRKEAAKRFRKWVTSEVLPAIRRHGRYDPEALAATLPPEAKAACLTTEADALLSRSHYLRHQAEISLVVPGQITVLEFLRKHGIALQGGPVGRLSQACKLRADQLGIPCGFSRSATIAGRRQRLSRPARTFPESVLTEICGSAA
jgi:prophage antirepressor-like protein